MIEDQVLPAATLEFEVRSGGSVIIDTTRCGECKSKACVTICAAQGGPLVLDVERQVPTLRWSVAEVRRGGCVECLGCELSCELYGGHAVHITLPVPRLDEYLGSVRESLVYHAT